MESVYLKERTRVSTILYLVGFFGLGMIAISAGVFLLILHEEPFLRYAIVGSAAILFGFAYSTYGVLSLVWSLREYELSERGIEIRYLKRKVILYPWHSITKISVWKHNSSGVFHEYIWCAVGKPKRWIQNIRQPNSLYEILHRRSIVSVEYSPERLEQFRKYYRNEIEDFRGLYEPTPSGYFDTYHAEEGDSPPEQ